jgi:hypothetical protein
LFERTSGEVGAAGAEAGNCEILVELFFAGTLGPLLLVATNTEDVLILLGFILSYNDAMCAIGAVDFFHGCLPSSKASFREEASGSRLFAFSLQEDLVDKVLQPVFVCRAEILELHSHCLSYDSHDHTLPFKRRLGDLESHLQLISNVKRRTSDQSQAARSNIRKGTWQEFVMSQDLKVRRQVDLRSGLLSLLLVGRSEAHGCIHKFPPATETCDMRLICQSQMEPFTR